MSGMLSRTRAIVLMGLSAGLSSVASSATFNFATIDDPGAPSGTTSASGINDAGQIVGSAGYGFEDIGGIFTTIAVPADPTGHYPTSLTGINNNGQIVGYYSGFLSKEFGLLYSGGAYTSPCQCYVGGINDSGDMVGQSYIIPPSSFLSIGGTFTTIADPSGPYPISTSADGINNADQVVGSYTDASGQVHAFLYSGGTFTNFDDPSASGKTVAEGINNNGQVVGYYSDASGQVHGFLDIGGLFTTIDDPLATGGTYANGINDEGQIVGTYYDASGSHGFLATPATASPEPSTLEMTVVMSLGIAGFAMRKRYCPV